MIDKKKVIEYMESIYRYFPHIEVIGIDLNGEGSGILFKLDRVGPVELATTSFGQGVSVTAIHLTV